MSGYNKGGYNRQANKSTQGGNAQRAGSSAATGTKDFTKSEPILEKFMRPSKSGKCVATFSTQDDALVIPPNSRVIVTELNEKQVAGLTKKNAELGFKSAIPTHKLVVFAIEQ
jgi:hypothetical protein